MIPLGGYTSRMKMTEDEALREYIRHLDDLMSFVGREELPYSLRTLHMDRLLTMAREAREKTKASPAKTPHPNR
jgi:transcription antitermination factor NusG